MDHRIILEQVVESHALGTARYQGYWVAVYQSNEPLPEALKGSPRVSLTGDWKWALSYLGPTREAAIAQLNSDLRDLGIDPPEPRILRAD
jgi:hypothetical protein